MKTLLKKAQKISEGKPTGEQILEDLNFIYYALSNPDCKPKTDKPGPKTTTLLNKNTSQTLNKSLLRIKPWEIT